MNLLYIDHYAGGPAYGMEYRPYYLAREWVRHGHRAAIVGASFAHVRSKQPPAPERFVRETVDDVDFIWCKTRAYSGNGVGRVLNMVEFLRGLSRWQRWLDFEPDVVIASSTYPADIWSASKMARAYGAKLVWEVHDLWPLSPIELGGMSRANPFIIWMQRAENYACTHADAVISMLPMAQAHLQDHGMAAEKFFYVPNGVDPEEWTHDPVPLPAAHAAAIAEARSRSHLLVGYAGAHGIANDLGTLLEAAAIARDDAITWLLVGSGPEKQALARKAADRDLRNVVVLDPVPKHVIPSLLWQLDVAYLGLKGQPLFRFGISPNKLMDYMMAGRPVLCAIAAGNDLVSEAGCGITVPPGKPYDTVEAVRQMASMSVEQRSAMGRRGRDYILSNHTYPVLARRFIDAVQRSGNGQRTAIR